MYLLNINCQWLFLVNFILFIILFRITSELQRQYILGAYVPLTEEGNIVFDGVLASCYASFDHDLAHITMAPIQWFPEIIEGIFGKEKGSLAYVNIAKELGRWLLPYEQIFK